MVKRTLVVVFSLTLLLIFAPTFVEAVPVISAPSLTVNVGSIFTIPISVTDAVDLTFWQFDLAFDSSIVEALSFTDIGTDFDAAATAQGGSLTGITGFILSNQFSGLADSMSGLISGTGLQGDGSLVFLEFKALASGLSPLTLSDVSLNGLDTGFEIDNGQIPVTAVPEPTTLILLTSGLGLLGMRRLRKVLIGRRE